MFREPANLEGYGIIFTAMKEIYPKQPSHLSGYAEACLKTLVRADLADRISIGGALGLFHYVDYRPTQDVDAWWSQTVTEAQKKEVIYAIQSELESFGKVSTRSWGDVTSIELSQNNKKVFSFQIATRSVQLEQSVSAGWIDIPLDSLTDLIASKMVALVERGAPRDFLDIYTLCMKGFLTINSCWDLWKKRQSLAGSDTNTTRACLAIEIHLERIIMLRPLESILDLDQREQAERLRIWFRESFLKEKHE
jgi:hypothetical protein